jgi:hypothetical protein
MMTSSRTIRRTATELLCLLLCATCYFVEVRPASAQGTDLGTIRGAVIDSNDAAVPRARVVITDVATNITAETTTDSQGNYEVPALKAGNYKVTVTLAGFNTTEVVDIVLRGSTTIRVDARLTPRTLAEQITVTAEAPLIQSERPTIGGTLSTKALLDLPRDSRDVYQFLYLNPNITFNPDNGFKFLGAQSWGANFSLDGQRATGAGFGQQIGGQPSLETIGELNVQTFNYSAEYPGISNIRVTTKRGESIYHGSAFYDNKNAALAAWTIDDKVAKAGFLPTFATPSFVGPKFNFTELGGSFSGPVPKLGKRTFFLGAFERRYDVHPVRFRRNDLPSQRVLNGDFTKINDSSKPLVPAEITLTAAEVGANTLYGQGQRFVTIPSRLLNPVTNALVKNYFPVSSVDAPANATNGRLLDYSETIPGRVVRDLGTVRIDHDFNDHNRVYGTYNVSIPDGAFAVNDAGYKSLGTLVNEQSNHTLALSYTHIFSPAVINEMRGGLNNQHTYRRARQTVRQFLSSIGLSQSDINTWGGVTGVAPLDLYGQINVRYGNYRVFPSGGRNADRPADSKLVTFGDTFTWIAGGHSIRTGFDFVRNHVVDGFTIGRGQPRGNITYSGNDTTPLVRFLLGLPPNSVSFNLALRGAMDVTNWEQGYFIQDDFKINPRLTLYLGLRYEYLTPFVEVNDLLVNFDPAFKGAGGTRGRFIVPSESVKSRIDPRMITYGVATAEQAGVGRGLVRGDRNNFAPRLGVAFRLNDKTSLRGGYGFVYPTSAAQGIRDAMATNPFNQTRTKTNSPATGELLSGWPVPLLGGRLPTFGGTPAINAVPFGLESPRIDQFNVTVEREILPQTALRVSYLGTRMHGLIAGFDLNALPPNGTPFGTTANGDGVTPCTPGENCDLSPADQSRLPFPGLGDFLLTYGNIAAGRSNSFQMEVDRRFSKGLFLNASYTYLDQVSGGVDANSSLGGTLYNQFRPDADFGADGFVTRHRFVAYGSYDLPFGHSRRFGSSMPRAVDAIFGGWQTSFNMFIKSGNGFTPYWTCDNCYPPFPGNMASSALDALGAGDFGGTFRATTSGGNPYKRSGDKIWDKSIFGLPSVGADILDNPNNAKRGSLIGPSSWAVNLGIRKNFRITERVGLRASAVFDNLFNHPIFAPVGAQDFSNLGSFSVSVNPRTLALNPIDPGSTTPNPDFGRLRTSFAQEGIDSHRVIRLSLRLSF